jgi:hypothetical protein
MKMKENMKGKNQIKKDTFSYKKRGKILKGD